MNTQWHRDSELLKSFRSDIQNSRQGAVLKFFKRHLLPNHKSDWAETWRKALEHYRDSELLNSSVPISKMAAMATILKFFKRRLLPNRRSDWAETMESIEATQRFRIAKIVPFWYPRWPPWQPYWNSLNDISSQTISWIERELDGKNWSDIEIQNCLNRFVWLSKMGTCPAILKILKPHLLPNPKSDWAHTLREELRPHGD